MRQGDIMDIEYGYSKGSDRLYQKNTLSGEEDQSELYGYDALHRLTNFQRGTVNATDDAITGTPVREQAWVLDSLGNWEDPTPGLAIDSNDKGNPGTPSDARTHNSVNEISTIDPEGAVGSFNVTHDDAGNLSILPDRANPTTTADRFTYDHRNRLIKVEHTTTYDQQTPTWNTVVQYFYDGLNRRVKKDLNSGTDVIYLYDGWRCIEEREDDGGTWEARRQYVYGGIYIDEPLIFDKDTDGDGDCTDAGGSSRYFYCQQVNFNVVALADSSGNVADKIKYDPYGQYSLILDGSTGNTLFFQGQRWDNDTELYYFRNRDLSPVLGRFIQRDPMGYLDGMSLYECLESSPTAYIDPAGLDVLGIGGAVGSGAKWVAGGVASGARGVASGAGWVADRLWPVVPYPPPPSKSVTWGDAAISPPSLGNCYRYGCDDPADLMRGEDDFVNPGGPSSLGIRDCSYWVRRAKMDGLRRPSLFGCCKKGWRKVFLAIESDRAARAQGRRWNDYHWYRQEPGGTWSHKPGNTPVQHTDGSGNVITDPGKANRGWYDTSCGYLLIRP